MCQEINYFHISRGFRGTDVNIAVLYHLIKAFGIQSALELGVANAESTCTMLSALGTNPLWSIDTSETHDLKDYIKTHYPQANWNCIIGNDTTLTWETPVDLLFIDTSHSEEHTKIELEKYGTYTRKLIALHDAIGCPGVKTAIERYAESLSLSYFFDKRVHGLGMIVKEIS